MVCPTPQTMAYMGVMGSPEARCTNAITALLKMPLMAGDKKPITKISMEKKRPNLCLRNVTKATTAAQVCMNMLENKAHRKMWYHISRKAVKRFGLRSPMTLLMVSSSVASLEENMTTIDAVTAAVEEYNDKVWLPPVLAVLVKSETTRRACELVFSWTRIKDRKFRKLVAILGEFEEN